MKISCACCRFFSPKSVNHRRNECHRHSPQPRLAPDGRHDEFAFGIWPAVAPEGWCGEFKRRVPQIAGKWSTLEVVCHLYDEEREDFRQRLDIILHRPEAKWPPIDPVGWVSARKYNERDLAQSLAEFLARGARERAQGSRQARALHRQGAGHGRPAPVRHIFFLFDHRNRILGRHGSSQPHGRVQRAGCGRFDYSAHVPRGRSATQSLSPWFARLDERQRAPWRGARWRSGRSVT